MTSHSSIIFRIYIEIIYAVNNITDCFIRSLSFKDIIFLHFLYIWKRGLQFSGFRFGFIIIFKSVFIKILKNNLLLLHVYIKIYDANVFKFHENLTFFTLFLLKLKKKSLTSLKRLIALTSPHQWVSACVLHAFTLFCCISPTECITFVIGGSFNFLGATYTLVLITRFNWDLAGKLIKGCSFKFSPPKYLIYDSRINATITCYFRRLRLLFFYFNENYELCLKNWKTKKTKHFKKTKLLQIQSCKIGVPR